MKRYLLGPVMLVGAFLVGSALVQPALTAAQLRQNVPGSFLVYPLFDVDPPNATKLHITNITDGDTVGVRFIFICPAQTSSTPCPETHRSITLGPHATQVLNVGNEALPPGCKQGFVVAIAQSTGGAPIASNSLTGSYEIIYNQKPSERTTTGGGSAFAIQSPQISGSLLGSINASGRRELTFGLAANADYIALPFNLYGDFAAVGRDLAPQPAGFTEVDTQLVLLTLNMATNVSNSQSQNTIDVWSEGGAEHSTPGLNFFCWARVNLTDISPFFKNSDLGTTYGSTRINGNTNQIFGVIEEASATKRSRGNTVRSLFHTGLRTTVFTIDP